MAVGITGVFGAGKTTVSALFAKHGYKVINADEIGHILLNKKPIRDRIVKEFGSSVLTKNRIDRRKLKDIVFYDPKELIRLNRIIHPPLIKEIKSGIRKNKSGRVIVDGALLVEAGCAGLFDRLIVVKAGRKELLKRLLKKGKYNKKEIENISRSQLSQREKLKYADYIIDNSKSLENTKKGVERVIKMIKGELR
ncbi:dephospho-CoA kinase [Candidatus Woesearchaeota archaeon]|nr:dephospho-CoA kinase [Candidatus Woesearchaeota archaeon]